MNAPPISHARYVLRKLLVSEGIELEFPHQWVFERDRWKEFIFAVLTQALRLPQVEVRRVSERLQRLGLIEISELAQLSKSDISKSSTSNANVGRILSILKESGSTITQARKGLLSIAEAAKWITSNHDGLVQKCLRSYGELMVRDLSNSAVFTNLTRYEANYAIRLWLQNVINMPIPLHAESAKQFSKEQGLSEEQLIEAADEEGLNVALLDDLIELYFMRKSRAMRRSQ
jgi:hypothetical protein